MPGSIGVNVIANAATMKAMGIMEENDSESLDLIRFCNASCSFLCNIRRTYLSVYYNILKCDLQVLFVVFLKILPIYIYICILHSKIDTHLQFVHF